MKKLFRKIGTAVLAMAVVFSALSVASPVAEDSVGVKTVQAEELDKNIGDYSWKLFPGEGGGSAWINKYNGSAKQIILPGSLKDDGETYAIGVGTSAFEGDAKITKIAAPDGVEFFAEKAFYGCTSLTELAIGDSVQYIANNAFAECPNLKTYRFSGKEVSDIKMIENCGIGQDKDGNIYEGVTVYTTAGSKVDEFVKELNAKSKNGNTIKLVYQDDPYSKHTVVPDSSSGGSGSSGGSSGSSGSTGSTGSTGSSGSTGSTGSSGSTSSSGSTGTGKAADPAKQMGEDGTALGKGASLQAAEKVLVKYAKETDPAGSVFGSLQLKIGKLTASSIQIKWKKVSGAKKYVIYGNKCGTKNRVKKLATVSGSNKTFKKILGKKVKKGTYYKFIIVALNAKNQVVTTSKMVHGATKGGKVGNDKAVTTKAKKNKVTIKKGKTFKLAAKAVAQSKKLKVRRHRGICYESSNKKVATVSKKGVITGKKKGTCYVYAYAQNGVMKKIKVTVK